MKNGKVRIKTVNKFLALARLVTQRGRMLTVDDIVQEIHCCRGHAYNYLRALKKLFSMLD